MASEDTRDFTYEGTTYSVVARRTNRLRRVARRVGRLLRDNGIEDEQHEFAAIVAYSVSAKGSGWKPPRPDASDDILLSAFYEWDDQNSDLTDAFMLAIFPPTTASVTSPFPLEEGTDPN